MIKFECKCMDKESYRFMMNEVHNQEGGFDFEIGSRLWYEVDSVYIMVEHQISTKQRSIDSGEYEPDWFVAYEVENENDTSCDIELFSEAIENNLTMHAVFDEMVDFAKRVYRRSFNPKNIYYGSYRFEVVDSVPKGYDIWNIGGQNIEEGYIPLCRLAEKQPFPGAMNVDTENLKAIKAEGSKYILNAIGYGPKTAVEMKKYIERHPYPMQGSMCKIKIEKFKKAVPFLEKIIWE